MDCAQCEMLKRALQDRERAFATAQHRFHEVDGYSDVGAFNRARVRVDDATLDYEVSRVELEQHQRTHLMSIAP